MTRIFIGPSNPLTTSRPTMSDDDKLDRILKDVDLIKGYVLGSPTIYGMVREVDGLKRDVRELKAAAKERRVMIRTVVGAALVQAITFFGVLAKSHLLG